MTPRLSNPFIVPTTNGQRLACYATMCQEAGCDARDLHVHAVPIDERVESVTYENGRLVFMSVALNGGIPAAQGDAAVDLDLDLDSGGLFLRGQDELIDVTYDPRFDGLVGIMDRSWLDAWAGWWAQAKGRSLRTTQRRATDDLQDRQPDELLGWEEAFIDPRLESYRHERQNWMVADLYCVNPECDCREIILHVAVEGSEEVEAGAVYVDLNDKISFEPREGQGAVLAALWAKYKRRNHGTQTLQERWSKMREVGRELFGTRTVTGTAQKVGRNDPCSCGSGQKYKRCCGRR